MADVGIYTKSADILSRAGANCNATAITVAETDKYVLVVEADINAQTHYDWSTAWTAGTLKTATRALLTEIGACMCAQYVISYDMSGATLLEFQTRLDVLDNRFKAALRTLKEEASVQDAIKP